jgi:23S rRNA (guanosine2251-2'-O)-methyltransferase
MPRGDSRRGKSREPDEDVVVGRRPVVELLRAGGKVEKIFVADGVAGSAPIAEIRKRAKEAGVPLKVVPRPEIDALAAGTNHQGVVASGARYHYTALRDILDAGSPMVLFLDGVTDPQNLGSLLRSAEGAGITGVVLPTRRSTGVTSAARRASAGASELIPVARVANLPSAIDEARRAGLWIVALSGDAEQTLWDSDLLEPPVGLVLGAEGRGISPGVKTHCDASVSIPLAGKVESLNVGVAGAIVMFELARRRAATTDLPGRKR